jgi:nucleoid DNA-binding protein
MQHSLGIEAAAVVDIFFNGMADELTKGGRVEIRGFCSFFVKEYDGHTPGATLKQVNGSKLLRRSCRFLNRERN